MHNTTGTRPLSGPGMCCEARLDARGLVQGGAVADPYTASTVAEGGVLARGRESAWWQAPGARTADESAVCSKIPTAREAAGRGRA